MLRQHGRVLVDLSRYAAEAVDLQAFIDDAVVRLATALEIDHVKILRYRREHNDLFMEAGVGWDPGVVKAATFAIDMASPVGRAFQTALPVVVEDVATAEHFRPSEVLRAHGIVSLMNVPILADGAVWGVIEIDSSVPRRFTEDTTRFMLSVASLVTLVVRRADSRAAEEAAAAASAQEVLRRELLLVEMQHRVKNNFQIILGMLELRKPSLPSKAARDVLDRIAEGIMAMSLAHQQLSPTRAGEVLELGAYLQALTKSFVDAADNVVLTVKCDVVQVSIEQALPIGLIVNELITNSMKHAFDDEGGTIRVELHSTGTPGLATVVVADDGKGLAQSQQAGSGLTLIRALADQVRGDLEQTSSQHGTTTTLRFPPRPR